MREIYTRWDLARDVNKKLPKGKVITIKSPTANFIVSETPTGTENIGMVPNKKQSGQFGK